ncbi:MAG: hypothetical protein OXH13_03650 [Chloroflexi bacterium]|nr:hypothetical protein [Chloroflexota bacterium]MCY3696593.1 hypothetical protein [Chloroflexota bacterium]
MLYREDVYAQRRFVIPMVALATAFAVGGVWLLLGADQVGDGIGLIVSGALLGTVLRLFAVLHVRVEGDRLRARFGPWGLNLKTWEIDAARAEEYRWGSYGGWGLRAGLDGGRKGRAMSVPFLRTGVVIETKQGNRHYIGSRRPDELAAAVNQVSKGGS